MNKMIPLVLIGASLVAATPVLAREPAKQPVITEKMAARHGAFVTVPVYLPSRTPIAAPAHRWSLEADRNQQHNPYQLQIGGDVL
jgi:hypothetical protein